MKEYKGLTNNNRDEYDPEYDFCCDCKYFGEPCGCNRPNGTCGNYDRFLETYNRLAELEDKIEKGELRDAEEVKKETAKEVLNTISKLGSWTNNRDMAWFAETVARKLADEYEVKE